MQSAPVFILSDFGTGDTYTAQMKAAVLSVAGYSTPVIDLTHEISPGNIFQGAFHIRTVLPHLPEGSVVLAVVDPGVGSSRLGLAGLWQGRFIVAPDNGLISMLEKDVTCWKLPVPPEDSSTTFHGRDLFAPCAGRIALDPGWPAFLEPQDNPVLISISPPEFQPGTVVVQVLHTDRFGNCILNLEKKEATEIEFQSILTGSSETPLSQVDYYGQVSSPENVLILPGSLGFMEIAVNGGSASERLNLFPGNTVRLTIRSN